MYRSSNREKKNPQKYNDKWLSCSNAFIHFWDNWNILYMCISISRQNECKKNVVSIIDSFYTYDIKINCMGSYHSHYYQIIRLFICTIIIYIGISKNVVCFVISSEKCGNDEEVKEESKEIEDWIERFEGQS